MKINNILEDKYDELPDGDKFNAKHQQCVVRCQIPGLGILRKDFTLVGNDHVNDHFYELRTGASLAVICTSTFADLIYQLNRESGLLATRFIEFVIEVVGQNDFMSMIRKAGIEFQAAPDFNELVSYLRQNTHPYSSPIKSIWDSAEAIVHHFLVNNQL